MLSLRPTMNMMNEFLHVLVDMELNGISIDVSQLDLLDTEYSSRQEVLKLELDTAVQEVMGDTVINLNSPEQLSMVLFSRKVKSKPQWAQVFNLGSEARGAVRRPKKLNKFPSDTFGKLINALTEVAHKTTAAQCEECNGHGKTRKTLKSGELSARPTKCGGCDGAGCVFSRVVDSRGTPVVAGFAIVPVDEYDIAAHGFKTGSDFLEELLEKGRANGKARAFIEKLVEFSKIEHYKSNFIDGTRRAIGRDGFLHTEFMPCVTATGRLSSRNPNWQNQPRGGTFPIRRIVVSRFDNGVITEADYAQLEFRVAVELAQDLQGMQDIEDGVDVHTRTADIVTRAGQAIDRQEAKSRTFKPLYGGLSGTAAERLYYKSFLERYSGIANWHDTLCDHAFQEGWIQIPSGRMYSFPNLTRYPSGNVSNSTQIKNYPVQGFATADVVPVASIEVYRLFVEHGLQSKLINEVHDSLITDTHPDEQRIVPMLMHKGMMAVPRLMYERYGCELTVPLTVEVKQGINWLDMEVIL
jgi:DNA polymerase I-like protein with 3'-5' exonuclease and polymerase domains